MSKLYFSLIFLVLRIIFNLFFKLVVNFKVLSFQEIHFVKKFD